MSRESRSRKELLEVVRNAPAASTPAARAVMQRNRRRDSRAEVQLRSALHRLGLRFRVDYPIRCGPGRPIRPDIVFTKARMVVFVDGCFWHGCPEHGRSPKVNIGYWTAKIALNQDRDRRQTSELMDAGWTVIRVWEHEPAEAAARAIADAWARG
jgi:DNA mismatch endonuclease (patch repair protein)